MYAQFTIQKFVQEKNRKFKNYFGKKGGKKENETMITLQQKRNDSSEVQNGKYAGKNGRIVSGAIMEVCPGQRQR